MHDLRERHGEWAIVTGASSGIGAAFAQKLAALGMNLVLVARRIELLNELREKLISQHDVAIRCLQADLSQDGCLEPLVDVCQELEIGLVVNNAGSGVPGPFSLSDIKLEKDLIRLNCVTPVEITRHFLPGMLANRRDHPDFLPHGFPGGALHGQLRRYQRVPAELRRVAPL
jgi:short-subunit dehydrogenase